MREDVSEDEQQDELTRMLLRQHSLKKTLACLENKHERMVHQLQAAINHLKEIRGMEMTERCPQQTKFNRPSTRSGRPARNSNG